MLTDIHCMPHEPNVRAMIQIRNYSEYNSMSIILSYCCNDYPFVDIVSYDAQGVTREDDPR